MAPVQISATTPQPPLQVQDGDVVTFRGWYTNDFVASDGVTPVEGGDGQSGFYYEETCTINDDGNVVIPAIDVQPTTESNPSAGFYGRLFINGAPSRMIFGANNATAGWQIPVSPTTTTFGALALYNAAIQLFTPPITYATYQQVLLAIQEFAGEFLYAAVGINGIGQPSVAPVSASAPIFLGQNDTSVVRVDDPLIANRIQRAADGNTIEDSQITDDGTNVGCQTLNYVQLGDYEIAANGTRMEVNDTFGRANLFAGGDGANSYAGIAGVCDPDTSSAEVFVQTTGYTQFYGTQAGIAQMGDTQSDHNGTMITVDDVNQLIKMSNIPTSDPSVADAIWSDGGTLKISAG